VVASHATKVVGEREESLLIQLGVALAHQRLHQACSLFYSSIVERVVRELMNIVRIRISVFKSFWRRSVFVSPCVGVYF